MSKLIEPFNVKTVWRLDITADGMAASYISGCKAEIIARQAVFDATRNTHTKLWRSDLLTWEEEAAPPVLAAA